MAFGTSPGRPSENFEAKSQIYTLEYSQRFVSMAVVVTKIGVFQPGSPTFEARTLEGRSNKTSSNFENIIKTAFLLIDTLVKFH